MRVQGAGCRVQGAGCRVQGAGRMHAPSLSDDEAVGHEQLQGYLAHKKQPPPFDHHRSPGIGLLQGPTGRGVLMSEVPLKEEMRATGWTERVERRGGGGESASEGRYTHRDRARERRDTHPVSVTMRLSATSSAYFWLRGSCARRPGGNFS